MRLCAKTALALVALLLTAAPLAWAKPKISDLARQCTLGRQNACRQLAEIAVGDKDPLTLRAAVSALTDQALLAKVAMEGSDASVRKYAVEKLTNQNLLARVATSNANGWSTATKRALLAKGAGSNALLSDASVRDAAVEKLTDQPLLAEVASSNVTGVAGAAVKKLTDQTLLAKVAMEGSDASVRKYAVEKLTDQALLARVAMEGSVHSVRDAAVKKLTSWLGWRWKARSTVSETLPSGS
ncbi:MAG: hypothetical protein ABSH56_20005 [Bryobacteraceae bacterium]|jgi:hypothetical protein